MGTQLFFGGSPRGFGGTKIIPNPFENREKEAMCNLTNPLTVCNPSYTGGLTSEER